MADIEIEKDYENNTIAKRRWQLEKELRGDNYALYPLFYPNLEPSDKNSLNAAMLHGSQIEFDTLDLGRISGEAWLPNFDMSGFSEYILIEDLAVLEAHKKIKRLRK